MKQVLLRLCTVVILVLGATAGLQAGEEYHEGFEYFKIVPTQPTQAKTGQIEVVEVFWYGCPHCFRFEPFISKWIKSKAKNVVFYRVPASFNPSWEIHAKAFYTAQLLKIGEQIHTPFFDALHKQGKKLESKESIGKFFAKYGIKKSRFEQVFDSFQVEMRVKQAKIIVSKYGVSGVPTMIVNGKYRVSTSKNEANPFVKLIKIVNFLIARESKN